MIYLKSLFQIVIVLYLYLNLMIVDDLVRRVLDEKLKRFYEQTKLRNFIIFVIRLDVFISLMILIKLFVRGVFKW